MERKSDGAKSDVATERCSDGAMQRQSDRATEKRIDGAKEQQNDKATERQNKGFAKIKLLAQNPRH